MRNYQIDVVITMLSGTRCLMGQFKVHPGCLIPWNSFYICFITIEMGRLRHLSCFHCSRNRAYNYLHKVGKYLNTLHCMYSNRVQFTMQILQERKMQADQKENCEVTSQLRCSEVLYIKTYALKINIAFLSREKKI